MEMKNAEEASLVMEKEVYVAAMKGDVNFLEKTQSNEYLLRQTHEKNSILHIAIQNQRLEFIATILRRFPQNRALICGKNSQQNTPLHIAAVVGNKYVVSRIYDDLVEIAEGDDEDKPWRLKNSKGNTPAHEALVHGNVYVAMFFFCRDSQLALIVNDSKEALLHLAVKHRINYSESESIKSKIKEGETSSGTNCEGVENISMIEFLVEKACYVTCWADVNGLTPLHSAASLIIPYNLQIIRFIIEHCPQSTEVCDNSGKSILHLLINRVPNYQEAKNLLNIGEIYQLRNCQDYQGDTPLHIAASNMDIDMVRVLLEFGSNRNIKNVQGISPTTIIQQNGILQMVEERRMRKEECEAANRGDIEFLKDRMSMVGDDFLRSKDTDGKNFLHILFNIRYVDSMLEDGFNGFIEQVVCRDVSLVIQGENYKGNTPIHVLARLSNIDLLHSCNQNILLCITQQQPTIEVLGPIYIMQNADGNTPLHEALLWSPDDALDLRFGSSTRLDDSLVLPKEGNVTISDKTAVNLLDYHHTIASHLTQTFGCETKDWLEDVMPSEYKVIAFLFLFIGNIKGNTVLHLAIQNKHFQFIQKVFDIYEDFPGFPVLFEVVNKDGETPAYLLGEMETIHPDVEQKFLSNPKLRGIRSIWGIPKTQLQNYMGSMNVIAALLATITFTAAFTVPGGLNQDKGTPILINSKAFRQFLFFDVVAMCLSMMVLLCLLWIMASNKRDSVKTQDLAVALLLAAFIATIITFICGVYATLHPVNPNMAKGTVYLCLVLILSVLPFILSKAIYPFKNIIRYYFRIIKRSTMWKNIRHLYDSI